MKNKSAQKLISFIMGALNLAYGAGIGIIIVSAIDWDLELGEYFLMFALHGIAIYAVSFLQIIIHESGHLIFGLVSGYRFSSFRIGSLIITKDGGKFRIGSYFMAGTEGQCLMYPPESMEKIPYVLYNLGGVIMNVFLGAVFFVLWVLFPGVPILSATFLGGALTGLYCAVMNGVPMTMGMVNNDGLNALSLGKDSHSLRSFANQLRVNARMVHGERLRDMPRELFELDTQADTQNPINNAITVLSCNRLLDEGNFAEVRSLAEKLIADESVIGIYKNMLVCDLAFCEMLAGELDRAQSRFTESQKKFMAAMANNPSIIRTQYALALLCEKDGKKAEKYLANFEKAVRSYPYKGDVESERELIEAAKKAVIL